MATGLKKEDIPFYLLVMAAGFAISILALFFITFRKKGLE